MELRYLGFDQKENTRAYKFDGLSKTGPPVHFVVSADLTLFRTYRVGIQEGPGLCASKITANPEALPDDAFVLTDADMRAHADARALAEARKAEARRAGPRRNKPPQE